MVSSRCDMADCGNPPRWVLQQGEDERTPACICSEHWQELRLLHPHSAYLYSPLAVVRIRERISAPPISEENLAGPESISR